MIVNNKWLAKYTDIPFSPEELAARLTYLGLEATVKKHPADDLDHLIVGEVIAVESHPRADRLALCQVSTGQEKRPVVCGAPNVKPGQKVPLALPGCVLPNGMEIKAMKIRGVQSTGMILAEDELGVSDDHTGIMVLDEDASVGMDLSSYFKGKGVTFDIDLTPNRPDCTSHIGVARDITLLTDKELRIPEVDFQESDEPVDKQLSVTVDNEIGCPRYAARVLKEVTIGPSPQWLREALHGVGIRSINNVVDAANYVLMETGQPLHTFDYRKVNGQQINVRSAEEGEVVVTLDDVKRELNPEVLLICDGDRPIAVAGIMGLANSEISADTRDIVIESAFFNPATIRKGSKYLGLQTEASYRFERGVDPEGVIYALERITALIQEVAGGKIAKGLIDNYARKIQLSRIKVRFDRINQLLGHQFDPQWVVKKFKQLGCKIHTVTDDQVSLVSPSWRPDLEREVDYIEEVVRIFGMEAVPAAQKMNIEPTFEMNPYYELTEQLRTLLSAYGYMEVISNSLVKREWTQAINSIKPVKIKNPLSKDMAYLRTSLIPGLVQAAQLNINRNNENLQLFELGYVHQYDEYRETRDQEQLKFGLLLTGNIESKHWAYQTRHSTIFMLKGVLEDLADRYGLPALNFTEVRHKYFKHLIQCNINSQTCACLGELHSKYLSTAWDIENRIYVLEGDGELLFRLANFDIRYNPLPIYPAIERDVSIVVPAGVTVEEARRCIQAKGGKYLKKVHFYDLYKGKNIGKNKKSLTFNLVFQAAQRTLKDREIDRIMEAVHKALEEQIDAELR